MAQFKTAIGRIAFSNLVQAKTSDYGKTEWTAGFVIDQAGCDQIIADQMIEHASFIKGHQFPSYADLTAQGKVGIKPSVSKDEDGNKVLDEGFFLCVFKRQTTYITKQGDTVKNNAPRMYDSVGRLIDPIEVPRGSKGLVVYENSIYNRPANKGMNLRLVGFQIAELADDGNVLMEAIEGGTFVSDPNEEMLNL